MTETAASGSARLVDDPALWIKTGVTIAVVLGVATLAGLFLRDPITAASQTLFDLHGLPVLVVGTLITDSSLLPLPNEPLLLMAISAGVSVWTVLFVTSAASMGAGVVGYLGGVLLDLLTPFRGWLLDRNPELARLIQERGAYVVATAALLPIPFSYSTWSAGVMRVPFGHVLLASTLRFPKTAFYLWLIVKGWGLGSS